MTIPYITIPLQKELTEAVVIRRPLFIYSSQLKSAYFFSHLLEKGTNRKFLSDSNIRIVEPKCCFL